MVRYSLDGNHIHEEETRELKNDVNIENIKKMREIARDIMLQISNYLEYDKDDLLIQDDSNEIKELEKYADIYSKCSKLDLNDKNSLSTMYMGYDLIIKECPKILEFIKSKVMESNDTVPKL